MILRVLIVEDEVVMRAAFRKMMDWSSGGFELAGIAANGAEALAYADKFQVDIIITDLKMPVMDGLTLINELKKRDYAGVILVLSNYSDFELVRAALTQGASDYLLKLNVDGEILLRQLNAAAELLSAKKGEEAGAETDFSRLPPEYAAVRKEVSDTLQFIHAHFTEKITLDEIAGAVSRERSYICRIFRQDIGRNIFEYINDLRMRKAAALIAAGHTYMREVAAAVGISDQFYFARVFKKYYQVSPSEYCKVKKE